VSDFRQDRVGTALAGTNPTVLRRLRAGFAVIGDVQHLPGYSVLITDTPGADQLTDLPVERQRVFLDDLALLGRAVAAVCARRDPQFRRINLEIQGNTDAFLHAHVTPRYEWEPVDIVGWPAALHHWTGRVDPEEHALGPQHDELRAELVAEIDREHPDVAERPQQLGPEHLELKGPGGS
jgi:diadenosine tetraphosphate (Ap4A) HIT family hydrolase